MPPVVHARGLGRSDRRVLALTGLDLEVGRGSIVGLLGPSGAGKTTLVRLLALLARPSEGELELFGEPVTDRNLRALRQRIGYMPQEPALYEDLSARSNVRFFGRGVARRRVDEVLDFLGLADRAADAVQTMSGGMKQRVSLACALVRPAPPLLLDEPTAGIDPILRVRFWDEFRRLRDDGATLLVSTHQIDEAVHCDRLLLVRGGRLLADAAPDDLLRRGGTSVRVEGADGGVRMQRFPPGDPGLVGWLRALDERDGTLGRMLAVGYARWSVTAGFVLGYGALALVQTCLLVGAPSLAFGPDLGTRLVPVLLTTFVLSMVSIAMGVFVSAAARTEGQVFPTIPLLIIPTLLLCGLVLPLDELPGDLRVIAHALPATYAENVLLGLMLRGHDFAEELPSFLALAGYGIGLVVAASASIRSRE